MRRINTLLRGASHRTGSASRTRLQSPAEDRSLHVVDLFGWEANEVNSLEHLCINWSAERIQQHYIKSLFTDTIDRCRLVLLTPLVLGLADKSLVLLSPREDGVNPMFESSLYDCGPCIDLIGGMVCSLATEVSYICKL